MDRKLSAWSGGVSRFEECNCFQFRKNLGFFFKLSDVARFSKSSLPHQLDLPFCAFLQKGKLLPLSCSSHTFKATGTALKWFVSNLLLQRSIYLLVRDSYCWLKTNKLYVTTLEVEKEVCWKMVIHSFLFLSHWFFGIVEKSIIIMFNKQKQANEAMLR